MSCISSELKTFYEEQLALWTEILKDAHLYLTHLLTNTESFESLKFDSGEAMSWAKYTDVADFQQKVLFPATNMVSHYRNQLNGTGIVKMNLRRKPRYY